MKKIFALFALICAISLTGCGGGGSSAPNIDAAQYLEENYPSINAGYKSIKNNLASAIASKSDSTAVTEHINNLMEAFSDDFAQDGVNKSELATKLINKITGTTTSITSYSIIPAIDTSVVDSDNGTKKNSDGTISVATNLKVKGKKGSGGATFEANKTFNVKLKNEGTAENPDYKIISGFPTTSNDFN